MIPNVVDTAANATGPIRRSPLERRDLVSMMTAPAVSATRDLYTRAASDVLRVAALVEIAAAAAALARTVAKLHHLDPDTIAPYVRDATDMNAVLGRGRWLPTMTRHVPAPPSTRSRRGVVLPLITPADRVRHMPADQRSLFDAVAEG